MEKIDSGDWMQTARGARFWPQDPGRAEFDIFDLAAGLSNACRYNGQCATFYSVAEHSVLVSREVERQLYGAPEGHIVALAFEALWHDGTEALMPDLPRPWKKALPAYVEAEKRLWSVMAPWLNVPVEMSPLVKAVDNAVLMTEAHVLHREPEEPWGIEQQPAPVVIRCLEPGQARAEFLSRHFELARKRGYVSPFYHSKAA